MGISTDMLSAFVNVAERLSVTAAAEDLGISKGVVSKRIGQLEAALKVTLFSRSTRKIALTPAGDIYLEFARNALASASSADERLRTLQSDLAGQIRLTAPVSWGQNVLSKAIAPFLAGHPAIEIDLRLEDRILDVAYERFDIALRMADVAVPNLVTTPVAHLEWVICAAPSYLAAAGPLNEPNELSRHLCMNYWRESSDENWQMSAVDRTVSVRVRSRFRTNNPEAVSNAAVAGLGIALLPLYVCEDDLGAGRLVRVLPEWTPITKFGNRIFAVASPDRMRLSRNQYFLTYLKDHLR